MKRKNSNYNNTTTTLKHKGDDNNIEYLCNEDWDYEGWYYEAWSYEGWGN